MSTKLNRVVNNPYILLFSRLIMAPLIVVILAWTATSFDKMRMDINTIQTTLTIKMEEYENRIKSLEASRLHEGSHYD